VKGARKRSASWLLLWFEVVLRGFFGWSDAFGGKASIMPEVVSCDSIDCAFALIESELVVLIFLQ